MGVVTDPVAPRWSNNLSASKEELQSCLTLDRVLSDCVGMSAQYTVDVTGDRLTDASARPTRMGEHQRLMLPDALVLNKPLEPGCCHLEFCHLVEEEIGERNGLHKNDFLAP